MIIFPYILSGILGLLITYPLLYTTISLPLIIVLSIGIGLGISAIITFFSFLLFNQYLPLAIAILHLLQIGILWAFHQSLLIKAFKQFKFPRFSINLKLSLAVLLW